MQPMKALREPDRIALAKLLADQDPRQLQLVQEQLAERGAEGITFLESVVLGGEPAAQRNAQQMLRVLRETPRSTIQVCNHYLFRTLGFRGNRQDYYDPDNSHLNRVLDRRIGIPISLSVLYLLLARRLRIPLI